MFCQYRDIFGKPGTGVHQYRFMGVAIVDTLMTILAAILLSKYTEFPLVLSIIVLFTLGVIMHALFCVPTQATKYLGLVN